MVGARARSIWAAAQSVVRRPSRTSARTTIAIVNRHATLDQDAQLRWALASVGGQLHKSRIDNLLVGRGSGVSQVEIGFGGDKQLFDLTSYTRHIGADTTVTCCTKGVFVDRARGYFKA